jgi:hypothetical protein
LTRHPVFIKACLQPPLLIQQLDEGSDREVSFFHLLQYFRQFVVKSEVKHFILILAFFHFLRIVVKKYRIRLSNLSKAIFR